MKAWRVRAEIRPWEDGGYLAEVPALQGCWVVADTAPEAIQDLQEVIAMSISSRLKHGEPLPPDVRQVVAGSDPIEVELAIAIP